MSAVSSQPPPAVPGPAPVAVAPPSAEQIDASCRVPLVLLFLSAAVWLIIGSVCGLVASIKFHAPAFLADSAWLSYGRIKPAGANCMLYGFALQAGLGVALWMLARLGRTTLVAPGMVAVGGGCWNLGVAVGVLGILAGGNSGLENLEMPYYAGRLVMLGYLVMAVCGVLTFHRRFERPTYVSQWFLLAALFWFPWIYSTAGLLLFDFPVRGAAQAVIAWWYSDNLLVVWLGMAGLAAVFYFLPKLTGRELHSRYLALLVFWMLILFGSWGGIPASAPVPAWMPVASAVATVVGLVTIIAVAVNVHRTLEGRWLRLMGNPSLQFVGFAVGAFLIGGLMRVLAAVPELGRVTQFTWFTPAMSLLNVYGFFAMAVFGAAYYVAPRLMGLELPYPGLARAHFWTAAAGVLLFVVPLAVGGIIQGVKLQHADIPFVEISRGTLPFLRVSTTGDLLMTLGNLLFLLNLGALVVRFYRTRALSAWAQATAELRPAEVKP